jgi:hypothetical protein
MFVEKIKIKLKLTPLSEHKLENEPIKAIDSKTKLQISLRNPSSDPLSKQFPIRPPPTNIKVYSQLSDTEKGDYLVEKVYETVSSFDNIKEIANTSAISGNQFDIVIRTNDGMLRGIQIKTLAHRKYNDEKVYEQYYSVINHNVYLDETLMIFATAKYDRFVVAQWKNIKHMSILSANFTNVCTNSSFMMFNDIKAYENHIYQQIYTAVPILDVRDGITSPGGLIEYDFAKKVKAVAESLNIKFEYENTDGSPIDFYLSGYACQAKVTNIIKKSQYHFHISKTINKKNCPYTDEDGIQYFVFGINDNQYKHDILIVPIQHLIQTGYIKTDNQFGITSLYLPPPHFPKYHYINAIWNNWDIIKSGLSSFEDPIAKLLNMYKDKHILIQSSSWNGFKHQIHISQSAFDDTKIKYFIVIPNDGTSQLYLDWIWIITRDDLIVNGKAPTSACPNKNLGVAPPPPYYDQSCWSTKYWQKIN